MASLNRLQIIGNTGNEPELRFTGGGVAVCNISVATNETWKDKATGEKRERVEWHRVVFYGALAETVAKYVKKGSRVFLEGTLRTNKWTDKQNIERFTTELAANHMIMLDKPPEGSQPQGGEPPPMEDDIPF